MKAAVDSHEWRWRAGGGYYDSVQAEALREHPVLPDFRRRRDAATARLFDDFLPRDRTPEVLELGCGASPWLPYLALSKGCRVTGLDYEALAVELTVANMRGAGAPGDILCRDAFSKDTNEDLVGRFDMVYSRGLLEHFPDIVSCLRVVRRYLAPHGVLLTTVPNFQGLNWTIQRFGDLRVLQTHVVYDVNLLRRRHEAGGFVTLAAGYLGFYDGFVSESAPGMPRWRRALHRIACRTSNLAAQRWLQLTHGRLAPERPWLSPHVYYVGRFVAGGDRTAERRGHLRRAANALTC